MSNIILVLKTVHRTTIRIAADAIESYKEEGYWTSLTLKSGQTIDVNIPPEEIDTLLTESYFMFKKPFVAPNIDYDTVHQSTEFEYNREGQEE